MKQGVLFVEEADGIATVVINRPEKRNAFTHAMWVQLASLIAEVDTDDAAKVVVLRSSDHRAFSAGADITEFRQLRGRPDDTDIYDQAVRRAEASLASCQKPTIAMISGVCVGGGCELAIACDFRFAASTSRFGITPANIGLVYSLVATKRLVDLVGPANAKLLLMSGELFDAQRCLSVGLITEVCADGELADRTYAFARNVASKAQLTVRGAKSIIAMILDGAISDTAGSTAFQKQAYASDDYREGVEAFLGGRQPLFS